MLVILIQLALVHSELHIWFFLHFLVDYEHIVLTIIVELIFLYDIAQSNNVGYGSLAEPNIIFVACHFCIVGHYHSTTVVLESHTAALLEGLCDQCRVAKQIHRGMDVQEYYLSVVQVIVEILCLVEDIFDVWLEFLVQLCELEPLV